MDSKIRIVTAALFFIALIAALVVVYTLKSNSRTISPDKPEISGVSVSGSYKVFQKNGLYGVVNSEDEIIIEAVWDYIYSPRNGKFIVGETKRGVMYYGAVDENGNTSIPVLYAGIDVLNSELLCAETFEGKFAIYNTELNSFSDEEFFEIKENSDGSYEFSAKNIIYTTVVSNRKIYIEKLSVNCNIDTTSKYIDIIPNANITYEDAKDYIQMAFESSDFIEALFFGNSEGKYSYSLLDDSVLLGENPNAQKNFYSLKSIIPSITNDESGIKYECCVGFAYGVPIDDTQNTGEFIDNRYEVNAYLTFQKDFEGNFDIISCTFSNS